VRVGRAADVLENQEIFPGFASPVRGLAGKELKRSARGLLAGHKRLGAHQLHPGKSKSTPRKEIKEVLKRRDGEKTGLKKKSSLGGSLKTLENSRSLKCKGE